MEKRKEELKKGLKSRYMSMIAIGGTIGAGLFFTSGSAINQAGPGGALVAGGGGGVGVFYPPPPPPRRSHI